MMAKPCACDTWVGVACAVLWGVLCTGYLAVRPFCALVSGSGLGWPTEQGESPVHEDRCVGVDIFPSSSGLVESAVNLPGPPGKPEYSV